MKSKFSKLFLVIVALLAVCLFAVACNPDEQGDPTDPTDPVKYTVTYVGGEGTTGNAPTGGEYAKDAKFNLPGKGTLDKADHNFGGWSYGGQTYLENAEFTMPESDVTFTAVWTPIGSTETYTVTFDPNNEGDTWNVEVADNGKVQKPATDPTISSGKLFRYWEKDGVAFDFTNTSITEDITLTAKYGWKVTFSAGEGNGTVDPMWVDVWRPNAIVLPDDTGLSHTSKEFKGWNDGTNTYQPGDNYGASDMTNPTLTAVWESASVPSGYALKFTAGSGEGTAPAVQYKQSGDMITFPENKWFTINQTDYPNYEFKGWSITWNGTIYQPGETYTMPEGDLTFQARWGEHTEVHEGYALNYTAGSHGAGTPPSTIYKQAGATITFPENIWFHLDTSYSGEVFKGWSTTWNGTIYQPGETYTMPESNLTFQARWGEDPNLIYTITYKPGDHASGNNVSYTIPKNQVTYNLRSFDDFSKKFTIDDDDNWVFIGWKLEGDNTDKIYSADEEIQVTDNVAFIAQWDRYTQFSCYDETQNATLWLSIQESTGLGSSMLQIWNPTTKESIEDYFTVQLTGESLKITVVTTNVTGTIVDNKLNISITYEGTTYNFVNAEQATGPVVTFDANGGSGDAPTASIEPSESRYKVTMPTNTFTAPADMAFKTWEVYVNGENAFNKAEGQNTLANIGDHVVIKAVWESTTVPAFEGTTFVGNCTVPTKSFMGNTTGGQTYIQFIVNFTSNKMEYMLTDGTKKTANLSVADDTNAPTKYGDNKDQYVAEYGANAQYFGVRMEDNIQYYLLISEDQTKVLICDSNDEPLTNGKFTKSDNNDGPEFVNVALKDVKDKTFYVDSPFYNNYVAIRVFWSSGFGYSFRMVTNKTATTGGRSFYQDGDTGKDANQTAIVFTASNSQSNDRITIKFVKNNDDKYQLVITSLLSGGPENPEEMIEGTNYIYLDEYVA